jgi:hypothetical protein
LKIAGATLTIANLTMKYLGDGIKRQDAFDGIVSGGLLLLSVSNPVVII